MTTVTTALDIFDYMRPLQSCNTEFAIITTVTTDIVRPLQTCNNELGNITLATTTLAFVEQFRPLQSLPF